MSLLATALSLGRDDAKEAQLSTSMEAQASSHPDSVPAPPDMHRRTSRSRMAIVEHTIVPPSEGGVFIPQGAMPDDWAVRLDASPASLVDRNFVFAGEQLQVLIHVSPHDGPETASTSRRPSYDDKSVWTPRIVAGRGSRRASSEEPGSARQQGRLSVDPQRLLKSMSTLRQEGQMRRSQQLLDALHRSHFFVRVTAPGEVPMGHRRQRSSGSFAQAAGFGAAPTIPLGSTSRRSSADGPPKGPPPPYGAPEGGVRAPTSGWGSSPVRNGCTPLVMEQGNYAPQSSGGLARKAVATACLPSGRLALLLEVAVASDLSSDDVTLDILQYERLDPEAIKPISAATLSKALSISESTQTAKAPEPKVEARQNPAIAPPLADPKRDLLHWLLPVERPLSTPPPAAAAVASPMRLSPPSFNFGSSRSSTPQPPATPTPAEEGDLALEGVPVGVIPEKRGGLGTENLLSFRGAPLEPQRFAAQCGLEGLHVPGRMWSKKVAILHPLAVESYATDCNAEQLICILVENLLPAAGPTAAVGLSIESISLECRAAGAGSGPLPLQVACIEVGEGPARLPGLELRPGEQHSFILRPMSPFPGPSGAVSEAAPTLTRSGSEPNLLVPAERRSSRHRRSSSYSNSPPPKGAAETTPGATTATKLEYAAVITARCSHTESPLHYRHVLAWKPRSPSELLLSVTLEDPTASPPSALGPQVPALFVPLVVTVQATNLTAQEMHLTLLAPSALDKGPTLPLTVSNPGGRLSLAMLTDTPTMPPQAEKGPPSSGTAVASKEYSRTASLPPIRRMESILGHEAAKLRPSGDQKAPAEGTAEPRTHLWLQSVVPLGRLPPHSTASVRCDLLPLVDGTITLDTLHACSKRKDKYYLPESRLQIYAKAGASEVVAEV